MSEKYSVIQPDLNPDHSHQEGVEVSNETVKPIYIYYGSAQKKFEEYSTLSTPDLRVEYLNYTDALISRMANQKTEVAVFLDKSARPVAWMVHALWDQLAPRDENGVIMDEPEYKFLNIDREQWGAIVGRTETGVLDFSSIPKERIDELRKVLAAKNSQVNEKDPYEGPSVLTDKRVMVIDEVSSSGDTLKIAKGILKRTFPDMAELEASIWMPGRVKTDPMTGVRRNTELPIWYSDKISTGRGVADRDTSKSLQSNSVRQRIGRYWLSTNFRERDLKGDSLRIEIKQMAIDLKNHELVYRPATLWSSEPKNKRVERLNGISYEDYVQLSKESRDDNGLLQKKYSEFIGNIVLSESS